MENKNLKIILILVCLCLLSTPIATFVCDKISNTTAEYDIARVPNFALSIRSACLILSMYFIFGQKEK